MARVKATSTDVFARLAKGECANFRQNGCQGRTPCAIIHGEPCEYFANYVKPLLDLPDYTQKYTREAKITVALNPKAKVVRKTQVGMDIAPKATRVQSPAPRAATPTEPAAPVTPAIPPAPLAAPAPAKAQPATPTCPVPVPQATKAPSPAAKAAPAPARARTPAPQPQLLLLDFAPEPPASTRTPVRRSSRG